MTIGGWIIFGFIALSAICFGIMAVAIGENLAVRICIPIAIGTTPTPQVVKEP